MKNVLFLALLACAPAFALELNCTGGGESISISAQSDKITVSGGYGELSRELKDPDCVYRSSRFACYEDGQLMINIPLALANGTAEKWKVFIQTDTGDNADSHNHALLGVAYACIVQ